MNGSHMAFRIWWLVLVVMTTATFVCQFCPFCCCNSRLLLRHTFGAHSSEPNFVYTCGIGNCSQTLSTFSAATSHWSRRHKGRDFGAQSVAISSSSITEDVTPDVDSDDQSAEQHDPPEALDFAGHEQLQLSRRSAGLFLLTLKERHQLTQSAVNFAVGQVQQMVAFISEDIRIAVESTLQQHYATTGVNAPDIDCCFETIDPFCGLTTEYLQTRFFRENFSLVVSYYVLHV